MFHNLLISLYRRWQSRSLSAKLMLPIVGLMVASLLGSTLAFVIGTARTQNKLLEQQARTDASYVQEALANRAEIVATAANMLAKDPQVSQALQDKSDASLPILNKRAVTVRDRFELDLIQIYNQQGEARTNLLLSELYRQSSLLGQVKADLPVVRMIEDRMLLLSRAPLPLSNGGGTVITGIDLETELHRTLNQNNLAGDLGLSLNGMQVGTCDHLPFGLPGGRSENQYTWQEPLQLGESSLQLLVTHQTTDITHVTNAGLVVMIGSTILTSLLLIVISIIVTRSITQPIYLLSTAAQNLAKGDLSQQVELISLPHSFGIGTHDEIGALTQAFNNMVIELSDLYQDLENKVEARTKQLAAAADVARAASSSLDLDIVLRTSVELICERFGFYHASVFLIEPNSNMAVLRESTSEPGQALKARKHQLAIGSKSLVGAATAARQPRIVQDVMMDPTHFKNPLLPDTRGEAVVPLLSGEAVIGALDVQSTQVNAFTPDVIELLTTLADQIAVAVQNARLYTQQKDTAEYLAEIDHFKSEFLATMSHELRTPLNSIIGFSRVILKGIDGPLTDLQKNDITTIYKNGQHLLSLINNILDMSKIEAGKMQLFFDEVDIYQQIKAAVATAAGLVKDKPVALEENIPEDLPLIEADETRVNQILLNLVSNAVKFTETGKITIKASNHNHSVTISVADTGIGIPPDKLPEIFKEFTQVDSSTTRRFTGTGLGLPITKKLIELHGGLIWVESEPDQGSTFTFTLPVKQSKLNETLLPVEEPVNVC